MRYLLLIGALLSNSMLFAQCFHWGAFADSSITFFDIKTALANKDDVKILCLDGQRLKKVPKEIAQLENLEELHLGIVQGMGWISTNEIKKLPEELFQLKKLKVLDLGGNELKEIPEEITQLENLEELYLSRNPFKQFPETILGLKNLKRLDLSITPIEKLPENFGDLNQLEYLTFGSGELKKLPESIGNLTMLKNLDLARTNCTQLPTALGNCNNLELIHLNSIDDLDLKNVLDVLKNIDNLRNLYLSNIETLPHTITESKSLSNLYIYNSHYDEPDYHQIFSTIAEIENLRGFTLHTGNMHDVYIPDEIGLCTQLENLDFYSGWKEEIELSSKVQKLVNLKRFGHLERIKNAGEVKEWLPEDCDTY